MIVCIGLFIVLPDQLYFKTVSYDMSAFLDKKELLEAENVYLVGISKKRISCDGFWKIQACTKCT